MIIPAKLQPGDCIGIFSPAGPVRDEDRVEAGIRLLQNMGFRVKILSYPDPGKKGYLAADDRHRVEELNAMLLDREVNALMALRGGYGCLRIADGLDYSLIRQCRKFIIGFSDVSILLNIISSRADIVTVHGPVLASLAGTDNTSISSLQSLLTEGLPKFISSADTVILRSGSARGVLRGGNLATLVHLLGTPWEVPWKGTLLLLEDTGEPMYKIDRMLTQLYHAGRLKELAGVILGSFDVHDKSESPALQEQVWQRILELTGDSSCPVWGNFPVGHRAKNLAVPLGLEMIMESTTVKLILSDT